MSKIYLIYENEEWAGPLTTALERIGTPFEKWPIIEAALDITKVPPVGVFFNRMSASSHTRGHRYSPEYTACLLRWLESHDRRVVNGSSVLQLELSKAAQYCALEQAGIKTPPSQLALGDNALLVTADNYTEPFIIKHNRAGKGLSVKLLESKTALKHFFESDEYDAPIDGLWIIQQYIKSPQPYIQRLEFINSKFIYAVKVDTQGGFELCPADVCNIEDAYCPVDSINQDKFEIIKNFNHPLIAQYEAFLDQHQIEIASFEFIEDQKGQCYTYDINTNTNYNSTAEQAVGIRAMDVLAQFLTDQLSDL